MILLLMVGNTKLGDNCIFFSFGEVYRRIYGRKFSFTATRHMIFLLMVGKHSMRASGSLVECLK